MKTYLALQKKICEKYDSAFMPLGDHEMIALALQTVGMNPVHGIRMRQVEQGDVGWFLYCGEYSSADDFYKPMHAEHLIRILPIVCQYLALAPGYRFIIDAQGYEDVWYDDTVL
ncbi:immunity protein Imm33 domain-containing protein [Chitinimonas sp. JJ19]|uniref:immunity protein Imm33 domain-containing protein n=1 Tax=Chitinimonas sp. JJ19 TaxID=3109352 RepID=UPI0030018255